LNQLVREACSIPYDQRSLIQRWAVRLATQRGIAPDGILSVEFDIEDMMTLNAVSRHLRMDANGRYFIEDITAWLLFAMTQPEASKGTIEWFWFSACLLFSQIGQYDHVLARRRISGNSRGRSYAPERFTMRGPWSEEDLARHFHKCGVRTRQASTLLHEFAARWLEARSSAPAEPNWDLVPNPCPLFNRKRAHNCYSCNML
jgi:hypothetical protein